MSEDLGKICPVCKRHFWVMYPHLWAYKRGYGLNQQVYFCSWKCLRTDEKKEKINVRRLTDEQRQEAVRIHLEGGDAKKYLEEIGCAGPEAVWYSIRKKLKETDPETWAKVQATIPKSPFQKKKKVETPEGNIRRKDLVPEIAIDGDIQLNVTDGTKVDLVYDGAIAEEYRKEQKTYTVTGIRTNYGEFHYDHKHNSIDWWTDEGDEIGMGPIAWKNLSDELPDILRALGVKPYEKTHS